MTENKKTRKPRKRSTTNKKKSTTNNKVVDVSSVYPENSCGISKEEIQKQYENIRTDFDNIDVCNNTTIDCGGNCTCNDDTYKPTEIVSDVYFTKDETIDIIKDYHKSIIKSLDIPSSIREDITSSNIEKNNENNDNYMQVVQDTSFLKNNKVEFVIDLIKKVIFYDKFFNKEGLDPYHPQLNGSMINDIREDNIKTISNIFHGIVLGYGISCLIKTIKCF